MNPAIIAAIGSAASDIGNGLTKSSEAKNQRAAYQALIDYATKLAGQMEQKLEARADKYDTKLQDQFNEAEPQFQYEANTTLPELAKLQQDVIDENTEAQRANRRQIEATMARQGIRGGQAAILENRALGEQSRDVQRDINQLAYNEAANRQNARLNYYNQKALTPWSTMSNAYGSSMVGANNALSNAQGGVYRDAYDTTLNNFLGSKNMNSSGWKKYAGGGLSTIGNSINTGVGVNLLSGRK